MVNEHAPWIRAIAHVDLDEFYAAVEVLDFPELKGKPVIVGGRPQKRGVVSTANYIARKFGVHSAMPSTIAARLCPQAVWRPVRMNRYAELSAQIHAIFGRFTDQLEPLALDEAFLELTGSQRLFGSPENIGREIKDAILRETGLVASVGLGENKFLAKLASDLKKPDGFVVVPPGQAQAQAFLAPLPVKRLWGAGPKTCEQLESLGLKTIGQLAAVPLERLIQRLGQAAAQHLYLLAQGIDERPVENEGQPKSIGRENTYAEDLQRIDEMERELLACADDISARLRKRKLLAGGVTLKVRFRDFTTLTRASSFDPPTDLTEQLHAAALRLLHQKVELNGRGIRLLGLSAHRLVAQQSRQSLLFEDEKEERQRKAAIAADELRRRFGCDAVKRARLLEQSSETTGTPKDRIKLDEFEER